MYITPLQRGISAWSRYTDNEEKRRRQMRPNRRKDEGDEVEISEEARALAKKMAERRNATHS